MLRLERLFKRLNISERGDAMVMALITLAVGSAVIVPTLNHVNTGVMSVAVHEQVTRETYAADAGVEYALWYIKNGGDPDDIPGTITFDGMTVDIEATQLTEMLWGPVITGDGNHSERLEVSTSISDLGDPTDGLFECTITFQRTHSEEIHIYQIGAWIGEDSTYVEGSTSGYFTTDDSDPVVPPDLLWDFDPPWSNYAISDYDPHDHVFQVQLAPGETLSSFVGWAEGQGQIGIVSSLTGYKIVSQANNGTTVTSFILVDSGVMTKPLSWAVN